MRRGCRLILVGAVIFPLMSYGFSREDDTLARQHITQIDEALRQIAADEGFLHQAEHELMRALAVKGTVLAFSTAASIYLLNTMKKSEGFYEQFDATTRAANREVKAAAKAAAEATGGVTAAAAPTVAEAAGEAGAAVKDAATATGEAIRDAAAAAAADASASTAGVAASAAADVSGAAEASATEAQAEATARTLRDRAKAARSAAGEKFKDVGGSAKKFFTAIPKPRVPEFLKAFQGADAFAAIPALGMGWALASGEREISEIRGQIYRVRASLKERREYLKTLRMMVTANGYN